MKRGKTYEWLPLWRQKWLWGSTRLELDPGERSVWIDLLCIAGNDDGHIRANPTTPYGREQLAGMLVIPVDLLNSTIEKCLTNGKLKMDQYSCLEISSWKEYQLVPPYKRQLMRDEDPKLPLPEDESSSIRSPSFENPPPNTNNKKENKKEKENIKEEEWDRTFDEFWKGYPSEGKHGKDQARKKFLVICRAGELGEWKKGLRGYMDFLKHKKIIDGFDQRPMYASTFMNGRWQEYIGFEYKPKL
jgi:hypothetical protein